jgi:Fibrinogen beta and gamma chains, C-terminal globular domain
MHPLLSWRSARRRHDAAASTAMSKETALKTRRSKGIWGVNALLGLVVMQACMPEPTPLDGAKEAAAIGGEQTVEARSALDACGGVILKSCKAILDALPEATDGNYLIDPDGPSGANPPFEVYCDMTSNGGGFTLLARTDKARTFGLQAWANLLAQNYFGTTAITTTASVPVGYLSTYPFFALLRAEADMPFNDLRIVDGMGDFTQSLASPGTLRQIHGSTGVAPLYQGSTNTGVLLLLGNEAHASTFPCYYPNINAQGCAQFFAGDSGSQTTAFYAGNLAACAGGPAASSPPLALWGSADCYATDSSGGFGGFTYTRPIHTSTNLGAYANGGYHGGSWSIYLR